MVISILLVGSVRIDSTSRRQMLWNRIFFAMPSGYAVELGGCLMNFCHMLRGICRDPLASVVRVYYGYVIHVVYIGHVGYYGHIEHVGYYGYVAYVGHIGYIGYVSMSRQKEGTQGPTGYPLPEPRLLRYQRERKYPDVTKESENVRICSLSCCML